MCRFVFGLLVALLRHAAALSAAEGRKLALLVGVEKYQHARLDDLKYCGRTAASVTEIGSQIGGWRKQAAQ